MLPTKTQKDINADLSREDSVIVRELLPQLQKMLKSSASKMQEYWTSWETADRTYRAIRLPDEADKESARKGLPAKTIIPLAYAQVQTATAFLFDAYANKMDLFEFAGTGAEDQSVETALLKDLNYQAKKANVLPKIYFNLLDGLKYGVGIAKTDWRTKTEKRRVQKETTLGKLGAVLGISLPIQRAFTETVEDLVVYEGNNVINVSPYAFYPDPSVPLARFQEGDFVGHEEERTLQSVQLQEGKTFFGTQFIKTEYNEQWLKERPRRSGAGFTAGTIGSEGSKVHGLVVLTEIQFTLNPSEWKDKLDLDFGTMQPDKWVAVVANDRRILSLQPLSYLHGDYTYSLWESSPDHNFFANEGLISSIFELQNMVSWFVNSHVASVSQTIRNRFIVDPTKIDVNDIENNRIAIRTKPGHTGEFNRSIEQLKIVDATANHLNDVASLMRFIQITTGVTENAQGIYSTGRRSAAQTRDVNGGAALRLNTIGSLHSFNSFEPMAKQFLANTRQNRTELLYRQIVGEQLAAKYPFASVYMSDPSKVAADYDFKPYRSVNPNEKEQRIASITELVGILLSNPQAAAMLNKDPGKLIEHLAEMQGIDDLSRFNATQAPGINAVIGTQGDAEAALNSGGSPVDIFGEQLMRGLNNNGSTTPATGA